MICLLQISICLCFRKQFLFCIRRCKASFFGHAFSSSQVSEKYRPGDIITMINPVQVSCKKRVTGSGGINCHDSGDHRNLPEFPVLINQTSLRIKLDDNVLQIFRQNPGRLLNLPSSKDAHMTKAKAYHSSPCQARSGILLSSAVHRPPDKRYPLYRFPHPEMIHRSSGRFLLFS